MPKTYKGMAGLMALVFAAGMVAAVLLFTSNFPTAPVSGGTSNCATLSLNGAPTIQGQSGALLATCGGPAAFTITGSGSISTTPTFTLPAGYTDLYAYTSMNAAPGVGTACTTIVSGSVLLTSGTAVSLAAGSYSYCADYASVPAAGLAAFSVTWNA